MGAHKVQAGGQGGGVCGQCVGRSQWELGAQCSRWKDAANAARCGRSHRRGGTEPGEGCRAAPRCASRVGDLLFGQGAAGGDSRERGRPAAAGRAGRQPTSPDSEEGQGRALEGAGLYDPYGRLPLIALHHACLVVAARIPMCVFGETLTFLMNICDF